MTTPIDPAESEGSAEGLVEGQDTGAATAAEPSLVLARIGLPYGNRLATWDASGASLIWEVPAEVVDQVGRGVLPRVDLGGGLFTEAVVVDQTTREILGAGDARWPAELVTEAKGPADNDAFRERLRQILVAAARRGETVILATGGLAEFDLPAARASVIVDDDGDWTSVVEAFPPVTVQMWADAEHDDQSSRMSAPADEGSLMGAAMLLILAASTFTRGPEVIGLYFEAAPDGPWITPEP